MEFSNEPIDVLKEISLEPLQETRVPLVRGYRGRFVVGNRESVGNKGGRPRRLTIAELIANPAKLDSIVEGFENGDHKAFMIMLDLLDGKIK